MYRNFDFARAVTPKVAENLNLAENYLCNWNDPNGCILKVGVAVENLVNHIAVKQLLVSPYEAKPNLKERIALLEEMGSCPKEIIQAMDYIRKRRNMANHEGWNKWYDAHECLKAAHRILSWYLEHYGLSEATPYQATGQYLMSNVGFGKDPNILKGE